MGLVTVDQAPVAVVVTGLACMAQGPAEPLAISAGPENESELMYDLLPLTWSELLRSKSRYKFRTWAAQTDMDQFSFSSVRALRTVGWSGELGAAY